MEAVVRDTEGTTVDIAAVEQVILESGFQRAIAKLKWLLPFRHPDDHDWDRLEDLSGTLNTTVLHDVVLDTFDELSRKHHFLPKHDPRKPSKTMVDRAMHAMVDHVQLREVLERNILFGNKLVELLQSGVTEYDLPEEDCLKTIIQFIQENAVQLQQEKNARIFKERRTSDAEIDLSVATRAVDDTKNQLLANMETFRLHERQIDNEVYETNARVDVELVYTDDFTEHQLQYMAFGRDYEDRAAYNKRMNAARRYDYSAVMHRTVKEMFREIYDEQEWRHGEQLKVAETEQRRLERQLFRETRNLEQLENNLLASKVAIQHYQRVIDQLRTIRAEEVEKEQALLRFMNAVIRIQRWWRYKMWLKSKKKKKKGKKGKKGKGKSKDKKGGKAKSGKKK